MRPATTLLLQEMKLAAIIHKSLSYDPTIVPAGSALDPTTRLSSPQDPGSALEMATINGAKALGLDDRIGTPEVGKGHFVAIDMRGIHSQPWFSSTSAVVYAATGHDVKVVGVDGRMLVEKEELITMDERGSPPT